jgi:type VI secretion system secreted protein VgrG
VRVSGALYPGKFSVLQSYDHGKVRPRGAQLQNKTSTDGQPGGGFEDYDNPGFSSEKSYVEADAAVRLESLYAANTLVEVEGNTMGLGVGDLVTLRKSLSDLEFNPFWSQADFKKEFLITSASYTISINQYETGDAADSDEPFKASFTLFDSQLQFRMPRTTPKPRIEGPQTAVVVGPGGDEIYTDKLGRVKVQFDWDRLGGSDQKSSIWVRVAQVWAGKQWGAIHIPRIGHEVIVEFLDGDPDRPIITGRVYNTDNMPPYPLPDKKTISGIKSRSSKGGSASNFNELSFEDEKGNELVYLQAELNMGILVKNDEKRKVGHDREKHVVHDEKTNVDGNRTETVGEDETITIHGSRKETVDGDEKITITGSRKETVSTDESVTINGSRTENVGKGEDVTITGNRKLTVTKDATDTVQGARTVNIGKSETVTVSKGRKQNVTGDDQLQVTKKLLVDGGEEIMLKSGSASITLKKDGTIIIKGKDVTVQGSGKINVKASSDLVLKGSKISGN